MSKTLNKFSFDGGGLIWPNGVRMALDHAQSLEMLAEVFNVLATELPIDVANWTKFMAATPNHKGGSNGNC